MKKIIIAAVFCLASPFSMASAFNMPGFVTEVEDGRLWVFKEGSEALKEFEKHGEPAKQFTNIGAGPNGMTIKAADQKTLDEYLNALRKNQ